MNRHLREWVYHLGRHARPDRVQWCDGSDAEYRELVDAMRRDGTLVDLDPNAWPNCYLHRSDPSDVASTEHLTFICSE